jgi:hypothetical protein
MSIKHFIRERILTFPLIILFLINLAKKSLQVSLNEFFQFSDFQSVTKQAFSKARKKIAAKTFILLNCKLIEEYYSDNEYLTWHGHRVIAVDGSDIQLPQNENLKEIYGTAKNQHGSTLAMATISYAYDVLNGMTIDAQIDRYNTSERDLAVRHIQAIEKMNHDKTNDLYIYDRGYPSLGFIFYHFEQKKDFVIRLTTASFSKVKKVLESGQQDVIIRLYAKDATDNQVAELKKRTPLLDRKNAYVDVRVVVITLSTGEKEALLTSLIDQKTYPYEEFSPLYNSRWGVEENYKWHKTTLELENFSGTSKIAIEQDLFSLVFTANIASLMMQEAQSELNEENKKKQLKHEYKINKRLGIATLKDELIEGLLNPDFDMDSFCSKMKIELKKHICPIRKNRKYERKKKGNLKYGCTYKKCI